MLPIEIFDNEIIKYFSNNTKLNIRLLNKHYLNLINPYLLLIHPAELNNLFYNYIIKLNNLHKLIKCGNKMSTERCGRKLFQYNKLKNEILSKNINDTEWCGSLFIMSNILVSYINTDNNKLINHLLGKMNMLTNKYGCRNEIFELF